MSRPRVMQLLIAVVGLTICVIGFWKYHGHYTDDAYISLRYCYNFLHGNGLVWNPGERVEGYTNFLFVMLVSVLGRLGIDLVQASRLVGLGAYASLIGFLIWLSRKSVKRAPGDSPLAMVPVYLTATSFCLIVWSVGGLETTLFSLLVTVGVVWSWEGLEGELRQVLKGSMLLGLATLTRPDGGLFFAVAFLFYLGPMIRRDESSGRRLAALLVPFLLLVGSHEIWRISYYGELVPNTFYAKGLFSWTRFWVGIRYLSDYVLSPPYLPILLFGGLVYRAVTRKWDTELTFFSVTIILFALYVAFPGGDHMAAFRPLVAIIPLMAILLAYLVEPLARSLNEKGGPLVLGLIAVLSSVQIIAPGPGFAYARHPDNAAYSGMIVGEYISSTWPAGSLVALNSAGATPYYAPEDRFIDMLGLNDKTIARRDPVPFVSPYQLVPGHAKGDGKYVFSRKPDFIIAGPSNGSDVYHALTLSEYELARIFEFQREYRLRIVQIPVAQYEGYRDHGDTRNGSMTFTYYERVK